MESSRHAQPADLPRLVELATAMRHEFAAMRGGDVWLAREARPEPLETSYAALLGRDDTHVVVGTVDGFPLGYGVVELETLRSGAVFGVITDLFVEPGGRDVSIGEAMLTDLLAFCTDHDCTAVDAWALPGHRDAKSFFETQGFVTRKLLVNRRLRAEPLIQP